MHLLLARRMTTITTAGGVFARTIKGRTRTSNNSGGGGSVIKNRFCHSCCCGMMRSSFFNEKITSARLLLPPPRTNERTTRRTTTTFAIASEEYSSSSSSSVMISSADNANVKRIVKLRTSKSFREKEKSVVVVGSTVLKEILEHQGVVVVDDGKGTRGVRVKALYAMEDGDAVEENVVRGLVAARSEEGRRCAYARATAKVMKKLAGVENADGIDIVAELEMPEIREIRDVFTKQQKNSDKKVEKVLCLDGVQDPGNVGTLLRTAEAFGFDAVGLGPRTCDPFNDKSVRSSKGTAFRMQMFTWKTNEDFFEGMVNGGKFELKRNVLAAMLAGESCVDVSRELNGDSSDNNNNNNNNDNRVCLVLGSEGQGVSEEIASSVRAVTIPTPGVTESLNVAVAGGILMSSLTIR
jgi:TrmH family RNA methyltransferase